MDKKAAAKYAEVMKDAHRTIRSLTAERDSLKEKVASMERRIECEKLASAMHEKGIDTDVDFQALTTRLEKEAQQGKLAEIRRAVDLVGPTMLAKTASLVDYPAQGGSSDLENYLLGHLG